MNFLRTATLTTAALSAVAGGVLFGFSSFIMPGLRRLPASTAVAAMQAINVAAPRSLFMVPLIGAAVGSILVLVLGLIDNRAPHRGLLIVGAVLGLGAMVLTSAYHVPQNNVLAAVDANGPEAAAVWASYEPGWTALNHLRVVFALVSAGLLIAATRQPAA